MSFFRPRWGSEQGHTITRKKISKSNGAPAATAVDADKAMLKHLFETIGMQHQAAAAGLKRRFLRSTWRRHRCWSVIRLLQQTYEPLYPRLNFGKSPS